MSKQHGTVRTYRVFFFFFWLLLLLFLSDCLYYSYVTLQYVPCYVTLFILWRILDARLNRRLVIRQDAHLKRREYDRAVHAFVSSAQKYSERNLQSLKVTGFHRPWNSRVRSFRFQRNKLGIAGEDRRELRGWERERETEKYTMPLAITFYQLSN